jgi:hypothetical protein
LCNQILQIVRENENTSINFDGFNNEIGASEYIVPNIIHFIRFNMTNLTFIDIVMIRAAHVAQKPDAIYIHTDVKTFEGKYWNILKQKWPDPYRLIEMKARQVPLLIYNRSISEGWKYQHTSDIERYRLLSEYGGIYLDNYVFIIQNLNKYRKFEMTIEWNPTQYLGNQVLIAHKDARFLRYCIETFRDYRSDLWYYNGGELPTTAVLQKHPEFIHRVIQKFGTDTELATQLFTENWKEWRDFDAIHALIHHRNDMFEENYRLYPEFNEHTILEYNFTFGELVRLIYFS